MKIELSQGLFAEIDPEDFDRVSKIKWSAMRHHGNIYATRTTGVEHKLYLHRFVLGLEYDDKLIVDHIDGDGLNNQKSNLRICTLSDNQANRGKSKVNTSGYKGVYQQTGRMKYIAQITKNKVFYYLGSYDDAVDAAKAYDRKAKELFGNFAGLNFED